MATVNFTFLMVALTVVISKITQPKVKDVLCIQTVMFTSVNGMMIRHMETVHIILQTVENIKANGNTI